MNKEEYIARYGCEAYDKMLAQTRAWQKAHLEEENARLKKYKEEHQEQVTADRQEQYRKGGRRYAKNLEYQKTGIPGEKNKIRKKHRKQYRPYKRIIAPDSQLHHEWIPKTSDYRGVALVEKEQHMYGFIDVIEILDGKITLLTEEQVRKVRREPEGL